MVRPDLADLTDRVARLLADTAGCAPSDELMALVEGLLTEGYASALAGDAWAIRAEQRMHDLVGDRAARARGDSLHALTREHAVFERQLIALRRELAELRRAHRGVGAFTRRS